MGWCGPGRGAGAGADHDRSAAALGDAEVGGVQDLGLDLEAQVLRMALELDELGAAEQLGDVLHHECLRLDRLQRPQVLAPQPTPLEADRLAVERAEALAGRTADHHVGSRERGDVLDRATRDVVAEIRRIVQEIITEAMMVLELPGETLRLGRDLGGTICDRLQNLQNTKAVELLKTVDLTPDSLTGTGTDNWTVFPQRMHFISDLFRSRQDYARLFEPVP